MSLPAASWNARHPCADPLLKAYYQRLKTKGKPAKVALTAVMRKLLIHLNSLLKTPTLKLS